MRRTPHEFVAALSSLTMNTYAHLSPALEHDAARALDTVPAVAETG